MAVKPMDVLRWIGQRSKAIVVTIVGVALLLAGAAMLVLPGPGLLVIIAGLAVLATQYAWAQRALETAKRKAQETTSVAKRWWRRRANKVDQS
jgi:uncharacterized protein (TIGR02611 family)